MCKTDTEQGGDRPKTAPIMCLLETASWPFSNLYRMIYADTSVIQQPECQSFYTLMDYATVLFASFPLLGLSLLCWLYTVDMAGASQGFAMSWIAPIVLRDLALMLIICGGWDYLLYFSPLRNRLRAFKFCNEYPSRTQLCRDIFWTTSATVLASAQEVLLMRWWAGGFFKRAFIGAPVAPGELVVPLGPFFGTEASHTWSTAALPAALPLLGSDSRIHFNDYTVAFILWIITMLYWRTVHFHLVHRAMHPWWNRKNGLLDGDVGAFLYRWVHSHHHKSYNCTAFSGISMTPVESILYMSAALIPLCFRNGCHPFIHLYTKLDLIIGAQIGHSGFDGPGGGSCFHQLHHVTGDCNYGEPAVPLDWLFGTFNDGREWVEKEKKKKEKGKKEEEKEEEEEKKKKKKKEKEKEKQRRKKD